MSATFNKRRLLPALLFCLSLPAVAAAQEPVLGSPLSTASRPMDLAMGPEDSAVTEAEDSTDEREAPAAEAARPRTRTRARGAFLARQLEFPRVRRAFQARATHVNGMLRDEGIAAPELLFRVFKRERVLEVWARESGTGEFALLESYPVCDISGRLGPKRREGDLQIPEGFYEIDLLNPRSEYHLSLHVDYPNAVDRARSGAVRLGGDIYIHGGCSTIGCVPITDDLVEEVYLLTVRARDAGQRTIPVHMFPTRLDDEGMAWLERTYGRGFVDFPFWENLREGYTAFEESRRLPRVGYAGGTYTFGAGVLGTTVAADGK